MFDKIFNLLQDLNRLNYNYTVQFKIDSGDWIIIVGHNNLIIDNGSYYSSKYKDLDEFIEGVLAGILEHTTISLEHEHHAINKKLTNEREEVHILEGKILDTNDRLKKLSDIKTSCGVING